MFYFRTETNGKLSDWSELNTDSESGAKRLLSSMYAEQYCQIWLAVKSRINGKIKPISTKHSYQTIWKDLV